MVFFVPRMKFIPIHLKRLKSFNDNGLRICNQNSSIKHRNGKGRALQKAED